MIRTEYGKTTIRAILNAEVRADFCCIVKSIQQYLMEDEDATKEQAKEEILEMVEKVFSFEDDDNDDEHDELAEVLTELLDLLKGGKADE